MTTKQIHEFDCYAYLCVNHARNIYPIHKPEECMAQLLKLRDGDRINIKGLGELKIVAVNVDGFDYSNNGKNGVYQEISIACEQAIVYDWKQRLDDWFSEHNGEYYEYDY